MTKVTIIRPTGSLSWAATKVLLEQTNMGFNGIITFSRDTLPEHTLVTRISVSAFDKDKLEQTIYLR